MSDLTDDRTVTRDEAESRYEVRLGDVLAGFTEYRVDSRGRYVFHHTEIDPAFGGRGLATTVVAFAMEDAAARGEVVRPTCPVVVKYLRTHEVPGLEIAWPDGV
ncbi:GNAT family N-acetyltransferase [Microbacterium sp.]|uniref:GNAT family N-acetyltransferase n=1 Tax=Microbacterium sp. TaxID=51671 RepID=UPI003F719144